MQWDVAPDGQRWQVRWWSQPWPPPGVNHGSAGICATDDGVVLVSRDDTTWELPAGRPEGEETIWETLRREVREEACCEVLTSELLGFTTSTCVDGAQHGQVLVRAHWAARVTVLPWRPAHEIVARRVVPVPEVLSVLTSEPGLFPLHALLVQRASGALGRD